MDAVINGARIHWERTGHGRPLFLLHAGCADGRMWGPQVAAFATHFDVMRPDTRGFGQSTLPPSPWSPSEDLLALMNELDGKHAHLVGCSMGGSIAIEFAIEHPERVSRLVLVGSAVRGYVPTEESRQVFAEEHAARQAGDVEALNTALMHLLLDGPNRPRGYVRQPLRDLFLDMNGRAIRTDHSPAPQQRLEPPAVQRLGEITAPTLVVVGDCDLPHVLDMADLLTRSIPRARKVVIHDAAHLPNLEHPEEFNHAVLDFLLVDHDI